MSNTLPPVGSFVFVPFGAKASQVAHVAGHTSTGRVKVRAWNARQGHWMPNTRTMDPGDLQGPATASASLLPKPPGH